MSTRAGFELCCCCCRWTAAGGPRRTDYDVLPDAAYMTKQLTAAEQTSSAECIAAAKSGDLLKLRALCEAGVTLAPVDADGFSALHRAAEAGHLAAANVLLTRAQNQSAIVDARCNHECRWAGATALFMAALHGHSDVVEGLLEHDAAVDIDQAGRTPLHIAAFNGHTETVRVLLSSGADHTRYFPLRRDGKTPLEWATARGHTTVGALLGLSVSAHAAHIAAHKLSCTADVPAGQAVALNRHLATHQDRLGGRPEPASKLVPLAVLSTAEQTAVRAGSQTGPARVLDNDPPAPDVKLHGRETFMDASQRTALWSNLPLVLQLEQWHLAYSSASDGSSLASLCRQTHSQAPLILACRSVESQVFGGFITHPLNVARGGKSSAAVRGTSGLGGAGRGEAWLFTFNTGDGGCETSSGTGRQSSSPAAIFRWTRANCSFVKVDPGNFGIGARSVSSYIVLCRRCVCMIVSVGLRLATALVITNAGLGAGGPGGGCGLWLDSQLASGSSEPCATFGNPSALLVATGAARAKAKDVTSEQVSGRVQFRVAAVEVWALGGN